MCALISKSYTFSAGSTVIASEHNSNYDTIYNEFNGSIDNANIKATAGIIYSKLNLSGQLLNADINVNAAIAGSKIYPAFVSSASVAGNITLSTAGNKLLIKEGVNASMGTAFLQGGTAIVSDTIVNANSRIFLTNIALGGTAGALWVSSITTASSFKVQSTVATDSSTIAYLIIEPA
jgi:hypothetical protein